ncbi:MAG: ATP-binding protein [Thermodesulfobacteriota bacterium]|nr:ATP-binding protein [Thermodesulfobacteriota bacterium]
MPLVLRNNRHDKEICTDIWQTISSGDTWQGRLSYQRKNGSEFIVEASISPILNSEGEIVSFVEVNRDITNEIKMEKQLRQAQKMEAIGNLAGGIAHDFNDLLFPIIGISELLMDNFSENSFEHDNLKEIFKAGRRGEALVKQILTFSRKTEDSLMPVNFQQVIKEVCKLIRSTIPADIEIVEHLELDCGMVMANPSQLHQIAMNLVTNAFHAVEPVKGKISLHLNRIELKKNDMMDMQLEPGSYAEFSVSDTGTGIAPDIITQIFDPYFTTKERGKGTGLGLATVYGIVKEYNGDIKVYSEPGKGTTFNVYLPLTRSEDDFAVQKKTEDLPPGNEHILLVDDEESIVQIEKHILERLGYSATAFTSSQSALKAFEAWPDDFDLVVSDMTMPEMNGDQLSEKLMQIKPGLPFIMCTGFSERINKEKAEQMGIKAFLMKPVAMHDFAQTVRSVLDRAKI